MTLKRPVTLAQARRWPAAAARRESFCARMGGMRDKLTSERTARDPRSAINRALAAWDCDKPEGLQRKHVTKGIRPMKITSKMVGAEARNPAPAAIKWEMYDPQSKTQRAMVGGVEVLVIPVRSAAEARSYEMPDWTRAILEVAPDKLHANTQLPHGSVREAKDPLNVAGAIQFARKDYKPSANPAGRARNGWRITVYDENDSPAESTFDSEEQGALLYAKAKADANKAGEILRVTSKAQKLAYWFDGSGIHPAGSYGDRPIYQTRRAMLRSNPARKAAKVKANPAAPARQKMRAIVRIDPKTGLGIGVERVPIDFDFRAYVGGVQYDFFARTEGAQLIVSERTTGAKVGAVPYTTRAAALNDREAAKRYLAGVIERVGEDRFKAAVAKAPKLTV